MVDSLVGHGGGEEDTTLSQIETIPDDIFSQIVSHLDAASLLSLEASQTLRTRVQSLGIPTYLLHHPLPHITALPTSSWPPAALFRHNHRINSSLRKRRWHSAQVGGQWPQAVIPVMELMSDNLFLGVGGRLHIHPLTSTNEEGVMTKRVERERIWNVSKRSDGSRGDIVGLAPLSDGQVIVAQYDGTIQRLDPKYPGSGGMLKSTAHYSSGPSKGKKDALHTLAYDGDMFMTTTSSQSPMAHLYSARSPWVPPSSMSLPLGESRAWASLVSTTSKCLPPTVMLGLSSSISIYDLPLSLQSGPSRRLTGPDQPARSSAYDIHLPSSNSFHHPSTLLSAWYDSHLRLHDLRSSSPSPVTEFSDPWIWADGSAMYSSTFFGEYGIAGGGARHGTVCLFDIRYPKKGWSVFSPGGKGSPVYSLKGEGGKIWGVTEKRAFVLAFDGSGDEGQGLLSDELMDGIRRDREVKSRSSRRETPTNWKGRGGRRVATSTREEEDDGSGRGYEHSQRKVELFDGLPLL